MNRQQQGNIVITVVVLLAMVLSDIQALPVWLMPVVRAAEVTIDDVATAGQVEMIVSGAQTVFTDDQTGYKFYVDDDGRCKYSKTTDSGANWGSAITTHGATNCTGVTVWFDQWTPGDTGEYIHIASIEPSQDDAWYNRLDTSDDTLWLGTNPINITAGSGYGGTLAAGANRPSITKGTDGTVYVAIGDLSDSIIVHCDTACNTAGNWSEAGTTPLDNQPDQTLMVPQPEGKILLLRRDASSDDLQYQLYDGVSWPGSAGWSTIDSNAAENTTYDVMMSVTLDTDFNIYLAYLSAGNYTTDDHDLRLAYFNSSAESWTLKSDLITDDTRGLTNVAIALDQNNNDVYVAYSARTAIGTAGSANVYFASSTAAMTSWGNEQGPLNSTSDDVYGVDTNVRSDQRVYVTWYEDGSRDVHGETLADVSPKTVLSTRGAQRESVRASTSDWYVGGAFVLQEFETTRSVSSITLSENGTVDGSVGVSEVALYYDLDTEAPYDCTDESYEGTESRFGDIDSNGFSGSDGVAVFSDIVTISPTRALCLYPRVTITKAAADGATFELLIADPVDDITLSGGIVVEPDEPAALSGTTVVEDDILTQTHFHFRSDTGNETASSSQTGGIEDVNLTAVQSEESLRLRIAVSNTGSTSSFPTALRLEYAPIDGTCAAASGWVDVDAVSDAWDMAASGFISDGFDATDIAVGAGGVSNENSVFLTPNTGLRDLDSTLSALTFSPTNWTEAEFSIKPTASVVEGETYCFRLSDAGKPIESYERYPRVTISADVRVSATGTQVSTTDIPSTDVYLGGVFTVVENESSRDVTTVTLTENGSADGATGLSNIRLRYDLDTTLPYDCASESYAGNEPQFGSTDIDGFSGPNGTSTFTDAVTISTTSALCLYPVVDVMSAAQNGDTIDISVASGLGDVAVSGGGSVAPATALDISGSTTLSGGVVAQTGYHWRRDNGSEATASSSVGQENVPLTEVSSGERARLRVGVFNDGATTSVSTGFRLEYGVKISTCANVTVWTDTDAASDAWDMYDSVYLTNGADTTNIATSSGGVNDPLGSSYRTLNGGVRDTESATDPIALLSNEFVELEYSIISTATTSHDTTYCFRVVGDEGPLAQYDNFAELTTAPKRDFKVQRGTGIVSGATLTLVAGSDYDAPESNNAFVRITNMHHTGAGRSVADNQQEADNVSVYVSDASNLSTEFTLARNSSTNDTVVSWELVEYVGEIAADNELMVLEQGTVELTAGIVTATGTAVSGVTDDAKVLVMITGVGNADATVNGYYNQQVTTNWEAATDQPVFERGSADAAVQVSYAVIEYTGLNWRVKRAEHSYSEAGVSEQAPISPVNSLSRAFVHAQKRMPAYPNQVHFGHEVWLSSIGAVSFRLSPGANPTGQVSVAWVVENTQTSAGAMAVQRRSGSITGGVEPRVTTLNLTSPLAATNNASLFAQSAFEQDSNNFPRILGGVRILSTTTIEIYNSDTLSSTPYYYRIVAVEWPTTGLSVTQNYYRFYTNNEATVPDDPWPAGATNLGENTTITALDEPITEREAIRLRVSLTVKNASLPAGSRTFALEYGERVTSCAAIETWSSVGEVGSGEIWRYVDTAASDGTALADDPPIGSELLLSLSDVAGRLVESSPSVANPYTVAENEDFEYDFALEHNGASGSTFYCFRVVNADGLPLDGYNYYPQLRTAGFTPVNVNWRWYDDTENEPPTSPLANETVAPSNIENDTPLILRVVIDELKNVDGNNSNFQLQFSEYADFKDAYNLTASSSCEENSLWCYADSAAEHRASIESAVVSGADSCISGSGDGCGLHLEGAQVELGYTHEGDTAREYSFALKQSGARVGAVYYFRLFDLTNGSPVVASGTYPSVVAEAAEMSSTISSVATGTAVAGIVADVETTPTTIAFGSLPVGTSYEAVHRLTVNTNASEGYRMLMYATEQLTNQYGDIIPPIAATNEDPAGWDTACLSTTSCFGYHTTDATLSGSPARFAPIDSYAALSTTPSEIMHSSIPTSDVHDVVYRVQIQEEQPAGDYETNIVYVTVPVY